MSIFDENNDEKFAEAFSQGVGEGRAEMENKIEEGLGYDTIVKIQERSGYQICYGGKLDFDELILAVKKIVE